MGLRDPVSSVSHLLVAVWAAYAYLVLIRIAPPGRRVSVAVFGGTMVLLYTASGVFHGVPFTRADNPVEFRFFQRLDQSAIFLLIAGTNTPIMGTLLGGAARRRCLSGIWALAAVGVTSLWLLPKPPHEVIVAVCLGMGWLGALPVGRYYRALGGRPMTWVWAGSLLYTLGAACELAEWPVLSDYPVRVGFHEVFHLLSGAASVSFFVFVARYVVSYPAAPEATEATPMVTDARSTRLAG